MENYDTPKRRIIQAVYVLFGIFSAYGVIVLTVFAVREGQDLGSSRLILPLIGIVPYLIGWGIRWIATGETSSVLDYL